MNYLTLFEGKTLNKLWPLLYLRAELDLRSTKSIRFFFQKIQMREREHVALSKELGIYINEESRANKLASFTILVR